MAVLSVKQQCTSASKTLRASLTNDSGYIVKCGPIYINHRTDRTHLLYLGKVLGGICSLLYSKVIAKFFITYWSHQDLHIRAHYYNTIKTYTACVYLKPIAVRKCMALSISVTCLNKSYVTNQSLDLSIACMCMLFGLCLTLAWCKVGIKNLVPLHFCTSE